jgi:hypothetical protein
MCCDCEAGADITRDEDETNRCYCNDEDCLETYLFPLRMDTIELPPLPKLLLGQPPFWINFWQPRYTEVAIALATLEIPVLQLLSIMDLQVNEGVRDYVSDYYRSKALELIQRAYNRKSRGQTIFGVKLINQ